MIITMGSLVMTLVSSAISIAKTVQSAKLASRGRSLQQQSARVDQGLNVPQPWTSIEQRLAHATYPYRVQDIKKSLNDNIIPLGYSLSLLSKWGFAKRYLNMRGEVKIELRTCRIDYLTC